MGCSQRSTISHSSKYLKILFIYVKKYFQKRKSNDYCQNTTNESESKRAKGEQELEPNHTHFLLLDDGTYFGYDTGEYRTDFVIQSSKYGLGDNSSQNDPDGVLLYFQLLIVYKRFILVPIVTVIVEGGPDTLTTIHSNLSNNIPVVVIDVRIFIPVIVVDLIEFRLFRVVVVYQIFLLNFLLVQNQW